MRRLLLCLLSVCAWQLTVSAHVLDQYLQVAQISLAADGIGLEVRLVPGVQVADRICSLIDADNNGNITTAEEQNYERRVRQDIGLEIDGVHAPLTLTEMRFPTPQEMREGLGTIRLTYLAQVTFANHQQLYFHNDHLPEQGVYLVNALMPAMKEIKIGGQERDALQRGLRLDFDTTQPSRPSRWLAVLLFCMALLFLQRKQLHLFLCQFNPVVARWLNRYCRPLRNMIFKEN